jgi:hypothetical protein
MTDAELATRAFAVLVAMVLLSIVFPATTLLALPVGLAAGIVSVVASIKQHRGK